MNLRDFIDGLSRPMTACAVVICALATAAGSAADWPQFLGSSRNGAHAGPDILRTWPQEGPPRLWQRTVGQGFSGPVIANGKLILFHRLNDEEVIECLEIHSGKTLWQFHYPARYRDDFGFDAGPRATPCIDQGRVFALGADGMLHCLDLATGAKVWAVDTRKDFGAAKGFFGMACSPLVEGDKIFLNIGGADGAGMIALNKSTGTLIWKATDHEASYSSPASAVFEGELRIVFFTRNGLVIVAPSSGAIHGEFPWRSRTHASVNAATPLIVGKEIFLSASYETGACLLRLEGGRLRRVWSSDAALSNHYATSVQRDRFLYGYHGRQDVGRAAFRCIEWHTGKVRWSQENFGAGTVTLAGDRLLLLHEDGRLLVAAASPDRFQLQHEAQVLPNGVRAHPALADGLFVARSKDRLVCLDLRQPGRR